MFPWHSTIVQPGARDFSTSNDDVAATRSAASSARTNDPADLAVKQDPSAGRRQVMHTAFPVACAAIERAARDDEGRLKQPSAVLQAIQAVGVKLGPQGAGTLLAIADCRLPTWTEWCRFMLAEGTEIQVQEAGVPIARGRGRGLGHLCSAAAASAPSRGRGRGRGTSSAGFGGSRANGMGASMGASARGRGGRA